MLDTKGPEIRIGTFAGGQVILEEEDIFTFTTYPVVGGIGHGYRFHMNNYHKMFIVARLYYCPMEPYR